MVRSFIKMIVVIASILLLASPLAFAHGDEELYEEAPWLKASSNENTAAFNYMLRQSAEHPWDEGEGRRTVHIQFAVILTLTCAMGAWGWRERWLA